MDQTLFFLINQKWTSAGLDRLMAILSSWDAWMPLLALLAVGVLLRGGNRARGMLVTLLLTVAITDGLVVNSLKHWVNRPRPKQVEVARGVDLQKSRTGKPRFLMVAAPLSVKFSVPESGEIRGRSFPSGHTSDNFAAAAVLLAFYPRRGWLYLPIALGVAYSRIYTGAHWPSDVLASIFLGFGLGLTGAAIAKSLFPRLKERFFATNTHISHI